MNYVFGSLLREMEYQLVKIPKDKLDRIESITDILVALDESFETSDIDYDVYPDRCDITWICPEVVIKEPEEREFYEAVELSDMFMCKANDDVETDGLVCLTEDMIVLRFTVYN